MLAPLGVFMNPTILRILVPVDFSAHSEAALHYATALASRLGAALDLLHVVEDPVATLAWSSAIELSGLSERRNSLVEEATLHLDRYRSGTTDPGVPTQAVVRIGQPTAVITEYARSVGVDLVVMGTHGQSGLAGMLLGNVAARVVRYAPCPVLTLHTDVIGGVTESPRAALPLTLGYALGHLGTSRE